MTNEIELKLKDAQDKAEILFNTAHERGYFSSNQTEKSLNEKIYALALELYGIEKYWHKRIVRSGPNTMHPYDENPPDLTVMENDILFFDFGPIFEQWEADYGRTYVIGNDPLKHKLKNDIEAAWYEAKNWFDQQTSLSGAD